MMPLRVCLPGLVILAGLFQATIVFGAEPKPILPEQFDKLHNMIKPQAGESRFWEIPWLLTPWEARQKAAADGKPLFVWAGSEGAPIGGC